MAGNSREDKTAIMRRGPALAKLKNRCDRCTNQIGSRRRYFHEKDATLIAEKVFFALKQLVGGWWEEKVDLTPCNGTTPKESRIREIRTYGSMRGRRS